MTAEVYESDNRRSVIDGLVVSFLKVTGDVRRSVHGVWWVEADNPVEAGEMAKQWAFAGKLPK